MIKLKIKSHSSEGWYIVRETEKKPYLWEDGEFHCIAYYWKSELEAETYKNRWLAVAGYNDEDVNWSAEEVIEARSHYGDYAVNSSSVQAMKDALRSHPNWTKLPSAQRETLEMCVHKFGRILGGDNQPCSDSWLDCQGYIELIRNPPMQ